MVENAIGCQTKSQIEASNKECSLSIYHFSSPAICPPRRVAVVQALLQVALLRAGSAPAIVLREAQYEKSFCTRITDLSRVECGWQQ